MVTETAQYSALHCFFNFKQNDEYLLISNTLRFICSILLAIAFYFILHIARHSFAKVAKEKGISTDVIQNILGHSKEETTKRYMGEIDNSECDKTMEKLFDN